MIQVNMGVRTQINLYDDETIKWNTGDVEYCAHIQRDTLPLNPRFDSNDAVLMCWHDRYRLGDENPYAEPVDFWRSLVAVHVSNEEVIALGEAGGLQGIEIDKRRGSYLITIHGGTNSEDYLCKDVRKENIIDSLMDELSIRDCMKLLSPHLEWQYIWMYEHSGISISCSKGGNVYADPFDSGLLGYAVCVKNPSMYSNGDEYGEEWRDAANSIIAREVELYNTYLHGDVYSYTLYWKKDGGWDYVESCSGFYGTDIVENGMAEEIGCGLDHAISTESYRVGQVKRRVRVTYEFD